MNEWIWKVQFEGRLSFRFLLKLEYSFKLEMFISIKLNAILEEDNSTLLDLKHYFSEIVKKQANKS